MADCKILIVGCNHGIQPKDADALFGDSQLVTNQKKQFANMIEGLAIDNEIEFIGEEWGLANMTSAHRLANASKTIGWANINTSHEDLDAMEIPRDYVDGAYSPEQKQEWSRQREGIMVKKLRESRGTATRCLVICGFEHVEPLADTLRKDCNTVERVDYRQQQWYQAGLFAE
jgi:aldehyde:ferredoxin oxidoreductase